MPTQKINKKELILKSIDVFNKMGYKHTSMMDIARAVGLQKGSIYHHFESKEQLLKHCIFFAKTYLSENIFHYAYQDELTIEERLDLIFSKLGKIVRRNYQGCFFGNLSVETSNLDEDIKTMLNDFFEEMKLVISYILKSKYNPAIAEKIADEIIFIYEGAVLMVKLKLDTAPLDRAIELIKSKANYYGSAI